MPNPTFAVNPFVRRQTKESDFSYFDGSFETVLKIADAYWGNAIQGYREGVMLVRVPSEGFMAAEIEIPSDTFGYPKVWAKNETRREGEDPRVSIRADADKQPAKSTYLVFYANQVLAEDGDNSSDEDYELISINGSDVERDADFRPPLDPFVLLHNHFGSTGGTQTNMDDGQLLEELKNGVTYFRTRGLASTFSEEQSQKRFEGDALKFRKYLEDFLLPWKTTVETTGRLSEGDFLATLKDKFYASQK